MRYLFVLTLALAACVTSGAASSDASPGDDDAMNPGGPDARPGTPDARTPDGGVVTSAMVTVIVEPDGFGGSELVTAINGATKSVYMTMYEIDDAKVLAALVARKQAGVDVQAILDGSTMTKSWNQPAFTQLQNAGVAVVWSSSAFTFTHEKTFILDGAEAWIMTMNSNTSSPKYNREYLARDRDPADVAESTAIFTADHAHTAILPSGALVVANNNARPRLVALIDTATTTLDVEDEEFSDSYSTGITAACVRAAKRGVTVHVVIANQTLDSGTTTAINSVKTAGGHVVMTGPTSGNGSASNPYIHAKAILVDCAGTACARGFVGSENMTAGSLGYNRELGVELDDATELAKVKTAIDTDYGRGAAQ